MNLKTFARYFLLMVGLMGGMAQANPNQPVQAKVAEEINCTMSHQTLDGTINHIGIDWTCTQPIMDWVTVNFDDGDEVDVLMNGTDAGTDHWFSYMEGYTTIYTVYLSIPTGQSFAHVVIIDDSPQELDCQAEVKPGETHNNKLFVLECDQPTSGWARFDFGDESFVDVWVIWLPDLQISWAHAYHWYEFDIYDTVAYPATVTYNGVTYPVPVEISQIRWQSFLPLVATP